MKRRLYSIESTTPNTQRISAYVNQSPMLVTALSPVSGYDKASAIAHKVQDEGRVASAMCRSRSKDDGRAPSSGELQGVESTVRQ